ncbi:siderophore-iron reductase FhuF [Oxalobacteraceae bacterium]|nr:siderophore-iron reductase FhuF [Oxalobacteraceae bacterium]
MMDVLTPVFRGEWEPYGAAVCCTPPPPKAMTLATLLTAPALLAAALQAYARHCGSSDLRPVASAWSRHYLDALLAPAVVAATLLRHRFALHHDQVWLELDENGALRRFYLPDQGRPHDSTNVGARYDTLLYQHLAPLFAALARLSGVAPKILWGNAARSIDSILSHIAPFESAIGQPGLAAHDRQVLLDSPLGANGERNPLYSRPRFAPLPGAALNDHGEPVTLTLHRQCCLVYLMPPQDYCEACPLDPQYCKKRA